MTTAYVTRSQIMGFIEETTENELKDLTAGSQFVEMRAGATAQGVVESITSDSLKNSIGSSKSYTTKEVPTASFPKYIKHSGIEGQEPQGSILIESCLGEMEVSGTEYSATTGSSAGTVAARGYIKMTSNQEDNFKYGQAIMIKDATNKYSIRNCFNPNSASNQIDLNFNLKAAPASGVALGKCVAFRPLSSGHPTFSLHHYQAKTGSALYQAMSGCRTNSMSVELVPNEFASASFDIGGASFYFNPIRVGATNKYIDFNDGGVKAVTLTEKVYKTPIELAAEILSKMDAASSDTITCVYSNSTGTYTIATTGLALTLLWNTGTNTANSVGPSIGFPLAADSSAALTYTGAAISFDTALTPSYDNSDNLLIRDNEILIGGFSDNVCAKASSVTFSISTPKTDVTSICAPNGVIGSVILSREVTFSGEILVAKHDSQLFDWLINNTSVSVMFNGGDRDAENWVPGKCFNIYLPSVSITAAPVTEKEGFIVFSIEAKAFVEGNLEDIYFNFL